jgi:hypothetical protein
MGKTFYIAFLLSDAFWEYFFASIPATLAAIGALIVSLRTKKDTSTQIHQVKELVNIRTDEMVSMARGMSDRVMAREESESTDDDPM